MAVNAQGERGGAVVAVERRDDDGDQFRHPCPKTQDGRTAVAAGHGAVESEDLARNGGRADGRIGASGSAR